MNKRTLNFFVSLILLVAASSCAHASKRILVDLTHQIAIAYQDGKVKFFGRISSGKPGRETPTGSFYVREKDIDHVSNLWPKPDGGAKMHYMLRITRDGVAMHLGPTPDYPASHGCIRMKDGFAQRMFAWAEKWTKVDIIGKAPAHSPALALPAYATSRAVLRKSLGGGIENAATIINTNPKAHKSQPLVSAAPVRSVSADKPSRHIDPLKTFSSNPKHHLTKSRTARTKHKKRRRRKARRDPHPNPLKAVSQQ